LCASVSLCLVGSSYAFSLHRIAASLDMGHIAAATQTGAVLSNVHLAVAPAAAELNAPSTEIEIHIITECDVEIQIVDEDGVRVSGARVHMPAGVQKVGFCGRDAQGKALPNGVYYYNVIVGDDVSTTRVTIAR
jgi:hypothetical protein